VNRPRVLNTRPREQAAELSRLLEEAGFEPVEAPAIDVVALAHVADLPAIERSLRSGSFDWVVLASRNAAHAFDINDLRRARVVCGVATARALRLEPAVALDRFSAADALDSLRGVVQPGQRALVPHGAGEGHDEVRAGLSQLGVEVTAPVVYSRGAVLDADRRLRAGDISVVTACSPSAVHSLASALRASSPQLSLVCLGDTTAVAARACGFRVDGVAERTTMPSLVEAVRRALAWPGAVA